MYKWVSARVCSVALPSNKTDSVGIKCHVKGPQQADGELADQFPTHVLDRISVCFCFVLFSSSRRWRDMSAGVSGDELVRKCTCLRVCLVHVVLCVLFDKAFTVASDRND